jgi:hypothetical protein
MAMDTPLTQMPLNLDCISCGNEAGGRESKIAGNGEKSERIL